LCAAIDTFLHSTTVLLGSHSSIIEPPMAVEMSPMGGTVTDESRAAASVRMLVSDSAKYLVAVAAVDGMVVMVSVKDGG
jgi:hypothetical protein